MSQVAAVTLEVTRRLNQRRRLTLPRGMLRSMLPVESRDHRTWSRVPGTSGTFRVHPRRRIRRELWKQGSARTVRASMTRGTHSAPVVHP